ncbi:MAG: 1-(5-phosphoribosyl)-5-amino-4-imidazole-carboxylate carboxylase, partial [Victivallales bacterium]|nr:1-(5-phosphoribosyl)-5-amino-4-imidazole-carboxylate carboxylase [Victivallales bacterium]
MNTELRQLLEGVKSGEVSIEDAVLKIKRQPFDDLGFAKVDLHRKMRQGAAEVIYGSGKTPEQILAIADSMLKNGQETILVTRLAAEKAAELDGKLPMTYHETARIGVVGNMPSPDGIGTVVVATGGTSDIPVAEEAALTAEVLGNRVTRLYDVGVAG